MKAALTAVALAAVLAAGSPAAAQGREASAPEGQGHVAPRFNWFKYGCGNRAAGIPQPFSASLFNFACLVALVVLMFRKRLKAFLTGRNAAVKDALEEAKGLQVEARKKLAEYTDRIRHLDEEIARFRAELRKSAEAERERIQLEATERAERLRREGAFLAEQELKTVREDLRRETVDALVRTVERILRDQATSEDQTRVAARYLDDLSLGANRARG